MQSNLLTSKIDEILETVLEGTTGTVYMANPSVDTIEALVNVGMTLGESGPSVRLLANERTLKDAMDDFLVASDAADLKRSDNLSLRTFEEPPQNPLLVTEEQITSIVRTTNNVGGLITDSETFVTDTYEAYANRWEEASSFTLRTPPITVVRQTLREDISPAAKDDFNSMLNSLDTVGANGSELDEVMISVLVAAKNEVQLYEISKWGEDVGVASKAKFSRLKRQLENMGLVETEKVQIDIGRPRLRLKIADGRLREGDSSELATAARSILS